MINNVKGLDQKLNNKLENFARIVENDKIYNLEVSKVNCISNIKDDEVIINSGRKYIKIDVAGGSGIYMVDKATGDIYGVKAYGKINKDHHYGNLDNCQSKYWGEYNYPTINSNYTRDISNLKNVADEVAKSEKEEDKQQIQEPKTAQRKVRNTPFKLNKDDVETAKTKLVELEQKEKKINNSNSLNNNKLKNNIIKVDFKNKKAIDPVTESGFIETFDNHFLSKHKVKVANKLDDQLTITFINENGENSCNDWKTATNVYNKLVTFMMMANKQMAIKIRVERYGECITQTIKINKNSDFIADLKTMLIKNICNKKVHYFDNMKTISTENCKGLKVLDNEYELLEVF